METVLMRGKPVADVYREAIAKKIAVAKQHDLVVTLAILVVGDDPASHVYKDRLVKLIESLGGAAKVSPALPILPRRRLSASSKS